MKRILYIIACFFILFNASAQQQSIQLNVQNNPFALNPGAAGHAGKWALRTHYRQDLIRFPGSPFIQTVTLNGKVANRIAVGGGLNVNGTGNRRAAGLNLGVAYNLPLSFGNLGIGLGADAIQNNYNKDAITTENGVDPTIIALDNVISSNINLGAHLQSQKYYLGLSLQQLAQFTGSDVQQLKPVINLYGAYTFRISDSLSIQPYLFVRNTSSIVQLDFGGKVYMFGERVYVGAGTRFIKGFYGNVQLGVKLKEVLHLNYSYDFAGPDGMQGLSRGGHELMLGWDFNWKKAVVKPTTDEEPESTTPAKNIQNKF